MLAADAKEATSVFQQTLQIALTFEVKIVES